MAGHVTVRDLTVSYGSTTVLQRVNLDFQPGTITALVGPNGSGKSTLLRAIAGLHSPSAVTGQALIDGRPLRAYRRADRVRKLAMVAQQENVSTNMTARHIVELGILTGRGLFSALTNEDSHEVDRAIAHADIGSIADRRWNELSGGERQRTQLARAMAQNAEVLVLDEPTNHLDIHHRHRLLARLGHQAYSHGHCVLLALHELDLAARYCDQVVVLADGVVHTSGEPLETLSADVLRTVFGIDGRLQVSPSGSVAFDVLSAVDDWRGDS